MGDRMMVLAVVLTWRSGWNVSRIWTDVLGLPERRPAMLRRLSDVCQLVDDYPEAARAAVDRLARDLGEADAAVVALRWELAMTDV